MFLKYHKRPWTNKEKLLGGLIREYLETRPRAITSINQMISVQTGLITHFNGDLSDGRF